MASSEEPTQEWCYKVQCRLLLLLEESDNEEVRTAIASLFAEHESDEEGEEERDDDAAARGYTSMTRAKLRYRRNGTLIVPDIQPFVPPTPTTTPSQLFPLQRRTDRQFPRFAHQSRPGDFLIYTDGACLNNGQLNPVAGWGFVFREPESRLPNIGRVSGRLEDHGPSGKPHPQTSNRAELRAVIAALQFRAWFGEGWTRLVIATDSEYVARGATAWVRAWGRFGWFTSNGTPVKNRDLWEELLRMVIGYGKRGMEVCFWRIPRAWNEEADRVAKAGAREERCRDFHTTLGMMV